MKRLRSYGDELGSAGGGKELDGSAPGMSLSSSSSFHHRRRKLAENGHGRPGPEDDERGRDLPRGLHKRMDQEIDGFDDHEGSRELRRRPEHDSGNGFDALDVSRSVRKRIGHNLDSSDDREGNRGLKKRIDHDFPDNFDEREGLQKRLQHDIDGSDRRKGFDRYMNQSLMDRGRLVSPLGSPWSRFAGERETEKDRLDRGRGRIHRSESFCVSRADFPKGVRSERDRSRREGSVSSWQRFGSRSKKVDGDLKTSASERGGSSSSKGGCLDGGSSSRESLRSPQRLNDVKSPTWSRDSKDSVEPRKDVKKSESMGAESGQSGSTNEMEEGELQPDSLKESVPMSMLEKEVENVAETENKLETDVTEELAQVEGNTEKKQDQAEVAQNIDSQVHDSDGDVKIPNKGKVEDAKPPVSDGKEQLGDLEDANVEVASVQEKLSASEINSAIEACESGQTRASMAEDEVNRLANAESLGDDVPHCSIPANHELDCQSEEEVNDNSGIAKSLDQTGGGEIENAIDLEVGTENVTVAQVTKNIAEENQSKKEFSMLIEKNKGKGVAMCSTDEVEFGGKGSLMERNFIAFRDDAIEGPSTRGFELFSCSAGAKADKENEASLTKWEKEKMKFEPLDLSLGLPSVSMPDPSCNVGSPQNSPPRARSVQSLATTFRTGSDGFTRSISFSGSQFVHNPSCSLTHNSLNYDCEQSVKSRPLFQGVDWQALAMNDSLPQELSVYQKVMTNVSGPLHVPKISQGMFSNEAVHGLPTVLDRSSSLQSQLSGMKTRNMDNVGSAIRSAGSHSIKPEYAKERRAMGEESGSRLYRSISQRKIEQVSVHEANFINNALGLVVYEPIQAVACKFEEMADQSVANLKKGIQEIVLKKDDRGRLQSLQEMFKNRSDLTLETLLRCHRVQLEILVTIKTVALNFLWHANTVSSTDLAEIFLNLKCRNPNCLSPLPVDECECKFCSKKDGFCSLCMCLLCFKFDTASNTCSWVGCDVCFHWCHTDCGLQECYIRNGRNIISSQERAEMQFYCAACKHPSEMFGFVKDVFKTCASEWKDGTMLKELEYVKRIFALSYDKRGNTLHAIASKLLVRLKYGSNIKEIYNQIMGFLAAPSVREPQALEKKKGADRTNNMATKDSTIGKKKPGPVFEELESLVRSKHSKAANFWNLAYDARREARRVKSKATGQFRKIDEQYRAQLSSLYWIKKGRRKTWEEVEALERSHSELMSMKTRMQEEIKELFLRMEDAKRSVSS